MVTPARQFLARAMSEDALQAHVMDALQQFKWRRAHFRPAVNRRGQWSTPVQGDGEGFPDIIALRDGRGIAIELKAERVTKIPTEQLQWLEAFDNAGFETAIWKPSNWLSGEIEEVLR